MSGPRDCLEDYDKGHAEGYRKGRRDAKDDAARAAAPTEPGTCRGCGARMVAGHLDLNPGCAAVYAVPPSDRGAGLRAAVLAAGPPPDAQMDGSLAGQALRDWWLEKYAPALAMARAALIDSEGLDVERLAAIEHEQWMTWARSVMSADDVMIGPERLARWQSYMVPYDQLPEDVKEHDRVWARRVARLTKHPEEPA